MSELTVYHLPGFWGLPSVSPFCLKLDAFLHLTRIDHRALTVGSPHQGPKNKAPWIKHKGQVIGDSNLIIAYLKEEFAVDPDAHLSPGERAMGVAITRLVEENLYWAMVYDRWMRPENWPILTSSVLGAIPAPIRPLIARIARRKVRKQLEGHGLGLHSASEIGEIAQRDIDALAAILSEAEYFFGDRPGMTDATVYSVLANIHDVAFHSPLKAMIVSHPNLVQFINRFQQALYARACASA